ncbi:MAG TPA: hypothetical protein PKM59_09835 [Thermodesulfobacteriota bacterium]|nr:hypothetical protein [Thermodesulfobacteriota bacterium]HNU73037.1 hypothetical protein [Thermodesulfobacteriota bacterium]
MVRFWKLVLALFLVLSLFGSLLENAGAVEEKKLTIVYQSDFKGYVEGSG